MSAADPKPLMLWIVESFEEDRAKPSGLTCLELYLRGVERYEEAAALRAMAERRRALRRELPLFANKADDDD